MARWWRDLAAAGTPAGCTGPVRECAADLDCRDGGRRRSRLGRSALLPARCAGRHAGRCRTRDGRRTQHHRAPPERAGAHARRAAGGAGARWSAPHAARRIAAAAGRGRGALGARAAWPRVAACRARAAGDAHRLHRAVFRRAGALARRPPAVDAGAAHRLTAGGPAARRGRPGAPQRSGRRCADRAAARRIGLLVVCGAVLSVAPSETRPISTTCRTTT